MIIRRYKNGDEEAITDVINKSFATFNEWGLTPEKWVDYERIDPGFSRDKAFVAEEDGKVIGHVQLVKRELNLGNFVLVSGVANVCTDPSFRLHGVATQVLKEALSDARSWSALSGLDTTYASGAHRIYRKLGFSPFHFFRRYSGEKWDVERAIRRLQRIAGPLLDEVRPFEVQDKTAIENIYSLNSTRIKGSVRRDHSYWEGKLFSRNSWQTFFYKGFKSDDLLVLPNRAYAYVDWDAAARRLTVREALSLPGDYEGLAAVYLKAFSLRPDLNEIIVVAPEGDPTLDVLLADLYQFRVTSSFMFSVLDMRSLLSQLKGFGHSSRKNVRVQVYNDLGFLEPAVVDLGDLALVPDGAQFDATLYLHQTTFLRLLAGLENPISALEQDKITISGNSEGIPKALKERFSVSPFVLWPSDKW